MDRRRVLWLTMLAAAASGAAPPRPNVDALGDPLPAGVVARLGTRRIAGGAPAIGFSPDGRRVVLAYCERATDPESKRFNFYYRLRLVVSDVRSGKQLLCVDDRDDRDPTQVSYSPDGKRVALHTGGGNVRVWDTTTGKRLLHDAPEPRMRRPDVESVGWLADNKTLFWHDGEQVRLIDVTTEKTVPLPPTFPRASSAALSTGGKTLALIDPSRSLCVWDLKAGKKVITLSEKWADPRLGVTPDGKTVIAAWVEKSSGGYELFDVATGKRRLRIEMGGSRFYGHALSADSKLMAVSRGGEICTYDLRTGKEKHSHKLAGGTYPGGVAFARDGRAVAVNRECRPFVIDTGEPLFALPGHTQAVVALAVSPDDREAFTLCHGGILCRWDLTTGKQIGVIASGLGCGHDVQVSSDGRLLVSLADQLIGWKWDGKRFERAWARPRVFGFNCAFSENGKAIVCSDRDAVLSLDARTGRVLRRWQAKGVSRLTISDNAVLAYAEGPLVHVVRDGTERPSSWSVEDSKGGIYSLTFLRDGRSLLATSSDGIVRLYEVATGKKRREFRASIHGGVGSLCVAPDGQTMAVRNFMSKDFELLSLTGSGSRRVSGHDQGLGELIFDNAGKRLLSGSYDGTVLVWDWAKIALPRPSPVANLAPAQLDERWRQMADDDAAVAFGAQCELLQRPAQAVLLLKKQTKAVPALKSGRIDRLIRDLDDDDLDVREAATKQLVALGEMARPALEATRKQEVSLEVRRRVAKLLAAMGVPPGDALRALRAVELLEWIGDGDARRVLEKLAEGEPKAQLTREAKASLQRLKRPRR